jgi:N-methylhydantoinase B/oxoprolinase/acetone carboxylase alpha subunit
MHDGRIASILSRSGHPGLHGVLTNPFIHPVKHTDIRPGDVCYHNDPCMLWRDPLNDLVLAMPVLSTHIDRMDRQHCT